MMRALLPLRALLATSALAQDPVEVFDLRGRRVAVLYDGVLRGQVPHQITWQPARLGNGTYVVRVSGASFARTQRVTYRR